MQKMTDNSCDDGANVRKVDELVSTATRRYSVDEQIDAEHSAPLNY